MQQHSKEYIDVWNISSIFYYNLMKLIVLPEPAR